MSLTKCLQLEGLDGALLSLALLLLSLVRAGLLLSALEFPAELTLQQAQRRDVLALL
jgi:hypothetical protein